MATLPITSRARLIMDLVKDGTVASLAAYANVELLDGPTSLKYAQAFWDVYESKQPALVDGNGDPRGPTNDELAIFLINRLRDYMQDVYASQKTNEDANAARISARASYDSEAQTDLSTEE